MRRPVVQDPFLDLFGLDIIMERRIENDEGWRDPMALDPEPGSLLGIQMPIEVTGEDAVEAAATERQRERVRPHERVMVPAA